MAEKKEIYKLTFNQLTIFKKYIRILGRNFFEKNKYIGRMVINNKIKPLKDKIKLKDIKEDKLIIKIIFFQKIKNKSYMFEDCLSLTKFFQKKIYYIKKNSIYFNYDKKYNNKNDCSIIFNYVTDMSFMFFNCESLKLLPDISKWNNNNVTNMSRIFYNWWSLESLPDISKWNTFFVNDMSETFFNCRLLQSLPDISEWNTNNVNDMNKMFYNCRS